MYIPILLPNPYTVSIIHPDLIYSDIFINPSDLGKNIKSTYIEDLGEISLEYCLKTILEENKNTTFHTIQYSKKQRKLCFYTDQNLNIEKWQEKDKQPPKLYNDKEDIYKDILNIFKNETLYDQDCASLYEILTIYRTLEKKINETHKYYSNKIQNNLTTYIEKKLYCHVYKFEYNRLVLQINCSPYYSSFWDRNEYQKTENNTIKEIKKENNHNYNILGVAAIEIEELIDFYLSIKETRTQRKNKIQAVNSNLYIDIDQYQLKTYAYDNSQPPYLRKPTYESTFYTYEKNSEHKCESSSVINAITQNESDFLKKIYVKIDDCPLWIREQLYNKRLHEIIERQQKEEIKQPPPQKKLTLFKNKKTKK